MWLIKLGAYYLQGENGWVDSPSVANQYTSEEAADFDLKDIAPYYPAATKEELA
jgi:hypothetical protein